MAERRRLMLCVAHPDDETFGAGGMVAKYASEGVNLTVVCATRGEAGQIAEGSDATPETLPGVREGELRESLKIAGGASLVLLGYRDSGMAGSNDNNHPRAFVRADSEEVAASLATLIREHRPHVVVSFEEGGGYGHPDHIFISRATRRAFRLSGDATFALGTATAPWTPKRLYYFGLPKTRVRRLREAAAEFDPQSPLLAIDPDQVGVSDEACTTCLDVSDFVDVRLRAIAAHRSQWNPFAALPQDVQREVLGQEYYIRVVPPWRDGDPRETDLFEGLDAPG